MKYILFAGFITIILPAAAHAQLAALNSVDNQCVVDGISGYMAASEYANKIINATRYDGQQMVWTNPAETRYCPNVIARYDAAAQRAEAEAQAEFTASLRRYGQ